MKYIHNPFPGLYIISSPCLLIVTYNSLLQTIREKEVSRHLLKQRRYKKQREDMAGRKRDAEAELNLPPGFRFHPTDEELVVDYLFRKITHKQPPVPIIADVDLYKCDPWQLPDKALFGKKEWYFFTPRDRKYPNGSRPNRAAGCGYWKATGADKPIRPRGSTRHVGIKKALVFYTGKAPKGIKTNWIMHEYRVAHSFTIADNVGNRSMKLDEWVLCRLYNKKNSLGGTEQQPDEVSSPERQESTDSQSFSAPESLTNIKRVNDNSCRYKAHQPQLLSTLNMGRSETEVNSQMPQLMKEDNWLNRMILNDLRNTSALSTFGQTCTPELTIDDYEYAGLFSPHFNQFLNDMMVPS